MSAPSSAADRRLSPERAQQLLNDRDWQVVRDVARLRLVSGQQLQRLHFGEGETAARATRRLLIRLTSYRVLVRLPRVVGGFRAGSSGFVYALGPIGDRLLRGARSRTRSQDIRDGFLNHTLALAELYVAIVEASRRGAFDIVSIETEPRTWLQLGGLARTDWLKPDLHVVLVAGDRERHCYVEWDNGTEHTPTLLRKLRQYGTALRQSLEPIFPEVVWLVPTQRRADRLRRMVATTNGVSAALHAVGTHDEALALVTGMSEGEAR